MLLCTAVAQMLVAKVSEAVPALSKGVGVEHVVYVATYWAIGCGSPSIGDAFNIIRVRETVNLRYPVFKWAIQRENWRPSTTIRHGAQDRGSRHSRPREKLPVFSFEG